MCDYSAKSKGPSHSWPFAMGFRDLNKKVLSIKGFRLGATLFFDLGTSILTLYRNQIRASLQRNLPFK